MTGRELSDEELLARIRAGDDEAAVEFLTQRYRRKLLHQIRCVRGVASQDADDVLQDAYLRFLRHRKSAHKSGFVFVIANSAARDSHRRQGHQIKVAAAALQGSVPPAAESETEAMITHQNDLAQALGLAGARCIKLFAGVMLGKTHAELARELDAPRGSISVWIQRCAEKVRAFLQKRGYSAWRLGS